MPCYQIVGLESTSGKERAAGELLMTDWPNGTKIVQFIRIRRSRNRFNKNPIRRRQSTGLRVRFVWGHRKHPDLGLCEYYRESRLIPNASKTERTAFHLNNHQAHRTLNLIFNVQLLKTNPNPVYLGVTLHRSLNHKEHLRKLSLKLAAHNSILQKLVSSSWGAPADTLRTIVHAGVYAPAEYACPAWKIVRMFIRWM